MAADKAAALFEEQARERQRAAGKLYGENHPKEELPEPGPQALESGHDELVSLLGGALINESEEYRESVSLPGGEAVDNGHDVEDKLVVEPGPQLIDEPGIKGEGEPRQGKKERKSPPGISPSIPLPYPASIRKTIK